MVLFLRKKPVAPPARPDYIPVDLVQRMAGGGMAERDIASRLASQGFSQQQIDTAMRAALKAEITAPPMRPMPFLPPRPMPTPPGPMIPEEEVGEVPPTPTMEFPGPQRPEPVEAPPAPPAPIERSAPPAPPSARSYYPAPRAVPPSRPLGLMPPREAMWRPEIGIPPERVVQAATRPLVYQTAPTEEEMMGRPAPRVREAPAEITVEEIVEGIVAEYWSEFEERLSNFEKRDIQLQAQIQDLKKGMSELEARLKTRESDMVGRLEGMTDSMSSIQGRIGSIEKVFKDFLPQVTENVRAMTEVVEKLRSEK